jgi:hypothetical protein
MAALILSIAAATAIFRFKVGMLVVLAASCTTNRRSRARLSSSDTTLDD